MISVYFLAGTSYCKTSRPAVVPTQPPFQPAFVAIPLTIFRTEIKRGGAIPLFPLYALMVWTGTNLPFTIIR